MRGKCETASKNSYILLGGLSANQANGTLLASDATAILDGIQPCIWYTQTTDHWFYWLLTGLETSVNTCWF